MHVDFRSGARFIEEPSVVVRRKRSGRWQVLEIAGEMDLQMGPILADVGVDPCFVVLDLHGVTFMDCSSLRALENLQQRARAAGGSLRLAAPSVQVLRILALTRMESAFPQFETVQMATSLAVTPRRDHVPRLRGRAAVRRPRRRPRGAGRVEQLRGALLRRMTIEPARRLETRVPEMRDRGRIRTGAFADITVFDPAAVLDRSTYADAAQYSTGIRFVLVNGVPVVRDGDFATRAMMYGQSVVVGLRMPGRPIRAPR